MKKKICLVRHAKSSWKHVHLADFDRPLNKRGLRDAPYMGKLMKKQGIKPDLISTSPALRAYETAKKIAAETGIAKNEIRKIDRLYAASTREIFGIINELSDEYNFVMIFAHNPGLTNFSNQISDKHIDNIPTSAYVMMEIDAETWMSVDEASAKIISFEYPKKYLN